MHERQLSSCIARRGYRAAAHGDRRPQCCLSLVSVAHDVVLENAGTRGLYKKTCFSLRLNSLMQQVRAPESRERGAQHGANHFEDDWCCDTNRGELIVILPICKESKQAHCAWALIAPDGPCFARGMVIKERAH